MAGGATKSGVPLTLKGTTANPVFTPDVGRMIGGAVEKNAPQATPLGKALGDILGGKR